MSELHPLPLSVLLRRASSQYDRDRAVFDLDVRRFYEGSGGFDLSVSFHGERASTPAGPAAGPHTQLAQNIALAFLAGGRILELKTVQVNDALELTRPCIDMATVGFNVEWSQELPVHLSAHEYAKARYLIAALPAMGIPERLEVGAADVLFDTSVGYDLDGIRSAKVRRFLRTMLNASAEYDEIRRELRAGLPREMEFVAGIDVPERLSECVTLSTFHGCPPNEIESICEHLMEEYGFHVVVKMNPTLMGYEEVTDLVRGTLGYDEIEIPKEPFDHDPTFDEGVDLIRSLRASGKRRGLMVGAKFTNTLFVKNHKDFFPGEESMYLSGRPLHVLSLGLAGRFRETVGADLVVSFSAGIDARNYAAAVSCGMTPVTACTDLLKVGGYGRLSAYQDALVAAMKKAGARTVREFILRSAGADADPADDRAVADASLINHRRAAALALEDERYRAAKNRKPPKKTTAKLELFDCINCDKCIPVCPNNANFSWSLEPGEVRYRDLVVADGKLVSFGKEIALAVGTGKKPERQIANMADLCNDCGNCDVFCPEEGGPQVKKPRIFSSRASFEKDGGDGFFFERRGSMLVVDARFGDRRGECRAGGGERIFREGGVETVFTGDSPEPSETRLFGALDEGHVVRLGLYQKIRFVISGLAAAEGTSYLSALLERDRF